MCRLGLFLSRLLNQLRWCEGCGGLWGSSEAEPFGYFEVSRGISKEPTELALMVLGEVGVAVREHEHSLLHSAGKCDLSGGSPSTGTGPD